MTGYQVSTPQLNFDVLAGMFAHVERKGDVSSLMKTCKTLYRSAIPHILYGGVTIWDIPGATSFFHFMLAKHWSEDRNRYLSHLSIFSNLPTKGFERLAFELAETIRHAVYLEELQIDSVDSLLIAGGMRVFEALQDLSSHRRLKKLRVLHVGEDAVQLLGDVLSNSITTLSLSFDADMDSSDPFPALQSLGSTITTLSLEWVHLELRTVWCPLLHTLSLQTHYSVMTHVLVFAFPNLLRFSVINEADRPTENEIAILRQNNQVELGQPHASWTHLRRLSGDPTQLYIMGLSCPVYELCLDVTISDVPKVLRLFDDLSPKMVNLQINLRRPSLLEEFEEFLSTAIQLLNNSCSYLSLYLSLWGAMSNIQEFMSVLNSALRRTMVRLLEVQVHYQPMKYLLKTFRSIECYQQDATDIKADTVGDYLDSMDTQSFALQIAQQVPALGHIGIELSRVKASQTYWEVVRSSEGTQVSLVNVGNFRDGHERVWRAAEETEE